MSDQFFSLAQHYHERTKYDARTIASGGSQLDWDNQPDSFKHYKLGTSYDLKPYLTRDARTPLTEEKSWQRLSRLLFCSYGLTLKVITRNGEPFYLRASPSAGGLYPAEVYLISRGTPMLPAGLYHYQPQNHALLQFWDSDVWMGVQDACFWHPTLENTQMALAITAIFYRSAWRYQARAYRRIFLDTGHLLGNIELAGAVADYRPHLIGGFADSAMNQLMYLDEEQEGAIAILALADLLDVNQNLPLATTALPSPTQRDFPKRLPEAELLPTLHRASQITPGEDTADFRPRQNTAVPESVKEDKYNFPFCLKVSTETTPIFWGDNLSGLETTILKRRSTRHLTGEPLSLDELRQLLDFTYHPDHYIEQGFDRAPDYFDLALIQTFIAVSHVDGLEAGCYYYAPHAQELRQIRFKNFREELHRLCLWQDLGRDAAAVLFHTADLKLAVEQYGDRAYRYLHMDAGHLGQRLNLAAIYLGLGVSGIGGFFDDEVNNVLGIPTDEAVLYITTLGRPG
jgi:SagB-type dehydrogenase family enzyme